MIAVLPPDRERPLNDPLNWFTLHSGAAEAPAPPLSVVSEEALRMTSCPSEARDIRRRQLSQLRAILRVPDELSCKIPPVLFVLFLLSSVYW